MVSERMGRSTPFEEVRNEMQEYWQSKDDVFGRICAVIFETTTYTASTIIADEAGCSSNSAQKHLERLKEFGIAEREETPLAICYRLNNIYFEWRVLLHLVKEYTVDDIVEEVESLEERQEELIGNTGEIPSISTASKIQFEGPTGSRMQAANELESIKRRIRLYELARQVLQNEGHLASEPL